MPEYVVSFYSKKKSKRKRGLVLEYNVLAPSVREAEQQAKKEFPSLVSICNLDAARAPGELVRGSNPILQR